MRKWAVLAGLLLAGCAVTDEIVTPNGQRGFAIQCTSQVECFKQAGQVCPKGYEVLGNNYDDQVIVECRT